MDRGRPIDASTFRIDHDPHEGHKQPERRRHGDGEEERYHSSEQLQGEKSSLSHHQDNKLDHTTGSDVGNVTTPRPGAVLVGGNLDAFVVGEEEEEHQDEDPMDDDGLSYYPYLAIAAQLVPDDNDNNNNRNNNNNVNNNANANDDDVEARINQEVEERLRQREENMLVAEAAKAVPSHAGGWTTGRQGCVVKFFLLVVILGGGVGGLLYGLLKNNDPNSTGRQVNGGSDDASPAAGPTESPVILPLDPLVEELQFWIAPTKDNLLPFRDPTSPQSQALAWLQGDPITQAPGRSTRTVLERYVILVLYYTTAGPSWGHDYRSPSDVCTWNKGVTYDENNTQPFYWGGIHCATDEGEESESIHRLNLVGNNLAGTIPWELVLLTNLSHVILSSNGLTGSIPTRINELTRLEAFMASETGLSGSLPRTFSPSTVFIVLERSSFTGTIPETWGRTMSALQTVYLGANSLTGPLPTTLEQLTNLTILYVKDNLLTGTLPSHLSQMSVLEQLWLSLNLFTGSMDDDLCLLTNLMHLESDCEEVNCPCCTTCSYSNDNQCQHVSAEKGTG